MQVVSPSLVPVLLAVTVASVAAGCGEDRVGAGTRTGDDDGVRIACTEVGCIGAATLTLRGVPATARSVAPVSTAAARTSTAPGDHDPDPAAPGGRVGRAVGPPHDRERGRARVDGSPVARGSAPIRREAVRPNGHRCTPTCWRGETTLRLTPAR
jgi:hypothetical protein